MIKSLTFATLCLAAATHHAHADDAELDVRTFEYLDVLETSDGTIWKGVVVEQTPNVQYKIATADGSLHVIKAADVIKLSKQKNRDFRGAGAITTSSATPTGNGLGATYSPPGHGLPAPVAHSGWRADPAIAIVFPMGDIMNTDASFSPDIRIGYEALFGNLGLGGGALARYTYWRLQTPPASANDAASTLETMAYVRAALHLGPVAIYGGGALGLDTNFVHLGAFNMTKTATGFGMNLQGGVELVATSNLALQVGVDYHPGTDTVIDGAPTSVSFLAIHAGASVRM